MTDLKRRLLGAWTAAVLLLSGGAATAELLDEERGAASPEEAGERLIAALNDADLLGVFDLLPAGERDLLLDLTDELTEQGDRLGFLDDDFRLDGLPGVELQITDPELDVVALGEGLAQVALVDGQATFELDGDRVTGSLGEVVDAVVDANGGELDVEDVDGEVDFAEVAEADEELADALDVEPFPYWSVVVVEDGGRWFPSLAFTIVESIRRGSVVFGPAPDPPDLDDGIEPDGGRDPLDAVQDLVDAATTADLESVLEVVDPGELGAVQVYADVLFGDLGGSEELGVDIEVTDADVESLGDGVRRVVPTGLEATIDLGSERMSITLEDGCTTIAIEAFDDELDDVEAEVCGDDDLDDLPEGLGEGFEDVEVPDELVELVEAFEPLRFGIVTVERGGQHYVSPIRTLFDIAGAALRGLEPEDVAEGGIVYEALTGGLADVFAPFVEDIDAQLEDDLEEEFDEVFPEDDGDDGSDVPLRPATGASGANGELLVGDVVAGELPAGETVTFTVIAVEGEGYVGAQATDGADLTITVLDAATGDELDYSDDFIGTDPEAFVVTAEGQVLTVEVAGFGESDAGGFVVYYET